MIKAINDIIKNHIMQNIVLYLIITLSFTVGICTGALTINALSNVQFEELSIYIKDFFNVASTQDINCLEIFKASFINNLKLVIMLWVFGITIIGVPLIIVLIGIKGFMTGFTVGFFIKYLNLKGALFSIISILPQSLILVPCYIILAVICVNYSVTNFKNNKKSKNKREDIKSIFMIYSTAVLIMLFVITIGSIVEAYITPVFIRLLLPSYVNN